MRSLLRRAPIGLAAAVTAMAAVAGFAAPANAVAPTNDNFADATVIVGPSGTLLGSNDDATNESGEPNNHADECCANVDVAGSVWFSWTAPATGTFSFDTDGSDGSDTVLGVYTGSAVDALSEVGFNDDHEYGYESAVTFEAAAGVVYRIAVGGCCGTPQGYQAAFVLNWQQVARPGNDDVVSAEVIDGAIGSMSGTTAYASAKLGEPTTHAFPDPDLYGTSVWYQWTAPADGWYTFDAAVDNPSRGVSIAAYTGSIGSFTEVAYAVGDSIAFSASVGVTYTIGVGGERSGNGVYVGRTGPFTLSWLADTTAPDTSITSTTRGTNSLSFSFDGTDDVASPSSLSFECKLDGLDWATCSSPTIHTNVAGGLHTVQVRAIDEAGNVDTTPASASIRARGGRNH